MCNPIKNVNENPITDNGHEDTNWGQAVTAVVIKDNRVLLGRHTYGNGKGKLILPGGYVNHGETPQQAVKREYSEETGVVIEPCDIIAVRFNMKDWYIVFSALYVSGEARSDGNENSEVIWLEIEEALIREDVAQLSKTLIGCAVCHNKGEYTALTQLEYEGKSEPNSLYGVNTL